MIIECQTCHTRFRLDESRIKGRGARVKCRKCGDGIVVLKDSAPAPPAQGGEDFFDLGSAVRDSTLESPVSPPPAGNLIQFPAPPRPVEPIPSESTSPAPETADQGKDEVDLAFDRFLSVGTEAEAETPVLGEPGAGMEPGPAGSGLRPDLDLGALTLDLGPEEKLDLPPATERELPFGESTNVKPPAEFRGEGGFLISDSDTLDFLQEKAPVAEPEAPPKVGDISLNISSTPVIEGNSFLREPEEAPPPQGDWTSSSQSGISLEGNVTPPAMPAVEVPPYREAEPAPAAPVEPAVRRESPMPESPRQRSYAGPAVAAVLAILLAAGAYLGLTSSGRKTLEGVVPGAAALWGGKPTAPAAAKYDLRNVIGYYESGAASPRILVIKGQVANLATTEKSGIRIHATLLDNTDSTLAQQVVYAGNMLSGETIRKGDRDTLSKALGNRFGEGLANMHLPAGKAIPFMVLFFDAPASMDSYKLEAKDGE